MFPRAPLHLVDGIQATYIALEYVSCLLIPTSPRALTLTQRTSWSRSQIEDLASLLRIVCRGLIGEVEARHLNFADQADATLERDVELTVNLGEKGPGMRATAESMDEVGGVTGARSGLLSAPASGKVQQNLGANAKANWGIKKSLSGLFGGLLGNLPGRGGKARREGENERDGGRGEV